MPTPEFKEKRKAFRAARRDARRTLKGGGTLSREQRKSFRQSRRALKGAGGNPGGRARARREAAGKPLRGGVLARDTRRKQGAGGGGTYFGQAGGPALGVPAPGMAPGGGKPGTGPTVPPAGGKS
jgi:hypothetical protein